jgi:hypothetical protein
MSLARLRALPPPTSPSPFTATAPDLLLRTFEPPPVLIRNQDLRTVLTPAYEQLATGETPA